MSCVDEGVDSVVRAAVELGEADIVDDSCVVLVFVVVVVPPVPTACLLLGIMPPGISSASICANPRKRESMAAAT